MCDLGIIPSQSVVPRPTGGAVGLWRFADCALIGCTAAYKHNSISGEEDEDTRSAGMSTNKRFTKKPRRDRRRRPEHPLLCVFFPTTLSTGGFIDPLLQCSGLVRRLRKSPRSCRDPTLYTAHCCLLTRLRISIPRPSQHTRNVLPPCPRWWFTSTSKSGNRPRRRGSFHFQSWRISVRYEKKKLTHAHIEYSSQPGRRVDWNYFTFYSVVLFSSSERRMGTFFLVPLECWNVRGFCLSAWTMVCWKENHSCWFLTKFESGVHSSTSVNGRMLGRQIKPSAQGQASV